MHIDQLQAEMLRRALVMLVGTDDPGELKASIGVVMNLPPEHCENKAAILNAIHVLLQTHPQLNDSAQSVESVKSVDESSPTA